MRKLLFVAAVGGAIAAYMKKQRERELDEAIWEEPRDLKPVEDPPTTA